VLFGIVEIGGVPDVAAALGVADTTVKTHLSRLFEKTGSARPGRSRQACRRILDAAGALSRIVLE